MAVTLAGGTLAVTSFGDAGEQLAALYAQRRLAEMLPIAQEAQAGYVTVAKTHRRRTRVTYLCLTRAGRRALEDYTAALGAVLSMPDHQPDRQTTQEGTS